jgi:hypothetical protein
MSVALHIHTGGNLPSDKIQPIQKVGNASSDMTNHFKLVRDCKKPVPQAQLQDKHKKQLGSLAYT